MCRGERGRCSRVLERPVWIKEKEMKFLHGYKPLWLQVESRKEGNGTAVKEVIGVVEVRNHEA